MTDWCGQTRGTKVRKEEEFELGENRDWVDREEGLE
jgi:hypothetical protein